MAKPLIVGVDIRDLKVAKTGTRTYLMELCSEFSKLQSLAIRFEFIDTSLSIYTGNKKLMKWMGHFQFQLWKQVSLPVKAWLKGCDIVFCTDNFVPLVNLGYKTIPVFHDAFFFETPQNYGKLWLWLYMKIALPAAKRSPVIVTPTAYSKKQIQHFTGISADKLAVVVEGARVMDHQLPDLDSLGLPIARKKYIFHAGSFFKRKNIPALVEAFAKLKTEGFNDLKLVLAGPQPANSSENDYPEVIKAIDAHNVNDEVIITGYLADAHLQLLYKNALLYAFPSINEGFGIPILEAFSNDVPVVVANNTCLPEVGGDAVITFNPFDVEDMANAMKKVLKDGGLREHLIVKGREQLKKYTWQHAAAQLVELFKKAANYS